MANRWGNGGNSDWLYFSGLQKLQMVIAAMTLKDACSWKKSYDQPRQHIKSRDTLCQQRPSSQSYGFSVIMYGCQSWTIKKAEPRRIDAFELWYWRNLESPLDSKEIKPVNPKGNQS